MLRVGLTGELGSGKSTVARLLAAHGAMVLSSDEMGRALMQPGEPVFREVVARFGARVLLPDGSLNRPELARLAFDPAHPRVEELNAIVHPAVLAAQEERLGEIGAAQPRAIVVIESALIFTTTHGGPEPWRNRFDRIVLVTAPDEVKIARFVARTGSTEADARRRLTAQRIPARFAADCLPIENAGTAEELARRTEEVWRELDTSATMLRHEA